MTTTLDPELEVLLDTLPSTGCTLPFTDTVRPFCGSFADAPALAAAALARFARSAYDSGTGFSDDEAVAILDACWRRAPVDLLTTSSWLRGADADADDVDGWREGATSGTMAG